MNDSTPRQSFEDTLDREFGLMPITKEGMLSAKSAILATHNRALTLQKAEYAREVLESLRQLCRDTPNVWLYIDEAIAIVDSVIEHQNQIIAEGTV